MFVRESKYDKVQMKLRLALELLAEKEAQLAWSQQMQANAIQEIERLRNVRSTFTKDEIRTLIRLCHPDRHGGSASATDMTAKLLSLRG